MDEPVKCAKIDGDQFKKTALDFEVYSFPTVIHFKNKSKKTFEGSLKKHTLESWVKSGDYLNSLSVSLKELDQYKESEHVFYTFFGDVNSKEFKMYDMIAKFDEFRFLTHTDDPAAIEKYHATTPGLAVFRHFDEPIVHLEGEFERTNVMEFLRNKGIAECMYFSEVDKLNIFRAKAQAAILVADKIRNQHVIDNFCTAAKKDKSGMMYAWASVDDNSQDDLREYINVHQRESPVLVMVAFEPSYGMMRYEFDGDAKSLTTNDVESFVKRFKSGALDRHYYDDQDKAWYHLEESTTIIYDNYEQIVMDTDNDVLVYYYSTSQEGSVGYSLHKQLRELITEIGRPDNLIIGRYDWHKGPPVDHPFAKKHNIVLYPKNDKSKGIELTGEVSVEQIKAFLRDNSDVYRELYPQNEDL